MMLGVSHRLVLGVLILLATLAAGVRSEDSDSSSAVSVSTSSSSSSASKSRSSLDGQMKVSKIVQTLTTPEPYRPPETVTLSISTPPPMPVSAILPSSIPLPIYGPSASLAASSEQVSEVNKTDSLTVKQGANASSVKTKNTSTVVSASGSHSAGLNAGASGVLANSISDSLAAAAAANGTKKVQSSLSKVTTHQHSTGALNSTLHTGKIAHIPAKVPSIHGSHTQTLTHVVSSSQGSHPHTTGAPALPIVIHTSSTAAPSTTVKDVKATNISAVDSASSSTVSTSSSSEDRLNTTASSVPAPASTITTIAPSHVAHLSVVATGNATKATHISTSHTPSAPTVKPLEAEASNHSTIVPPKILLPIEVNSTKEKEVVAIQHPSKQGPTTSMPASPMSTSAPTIIAKFDLVKVETTKAPSQSISEKIEATKVSSQSLSEKKENKTILATQKDKQQETDDQKHAANGASRSGDIVTETHASAKLQTDSLPTIESAEAGSRSLLSLLSAKDFSMKGEASLSSSSSSSRSSSRHQSGEIGGKFHGSLTAGASLEAAATAKAEREAYLQKLKEREFELHASFKAEQEKAFHDQLHQLEHDRQMAIDPVGHVLKHREHEKKKEKKFKLEAETKSESTTVIS